MDADSEAAAADPAGPDEIVDAVFAIACPSVPVDHAHALRQAIVGALPWFGDAPDVGLHGLHGAASGSGWLRPEDGDALLHLSRRTRLVLRLPRARLESAAALVGRTLDVAGRPLRVERLTLRPLARSTTLFSRGVAFDGWTAADEEGAFVAAAQRALGALGVSAQTLLCGRLVFIATPARRIEARSLMLAGLSRSHALTLQRQGLGAARTLGCGLFIAHKGVGDLRAPRDE